MTLTQSELADLKRSYQILGVPLSASAHLIKQTYRQLIRRWHPDFYANSTPAQAEATLMTKLINEAYSKIEHAPLRYYVEAEVVVQNTVQQSSLASMDQERSKGAGTFPKTDRLEFWIRFICGSFFGAFVSFRLIVTVWNSDYPTIGVLGIIGLIPAIGFAAARFGDKFWRAVLRYWWLWS